MISDERYTHPGWVGEPYKSDFHAKWGLIKLDEIMDCSHISMVNTASEEARRLGFQYLISQRQSKYGSRLYKVYGTRQARCVYGELYYQEMNAKAGRSKYSGSLDERVKQIVRVAHTRANNREIGFDLDVDDIIERVKRGFCEATGLALDLNTLGDGDGRQSRNPFTPSLDRVDSTGGYTKDNVEVVCLGWNLMKSNFDMELMDQFIMELMDQFIAGYSKKRASNCK